MAIDLDLSTFMKDLNKDCPKVQKKHFKKGEHITSYIAKRNQLCLMLNGEADLIRYDLNGNRTIVEHFSDNDIFGEIFYVVNTNNELFVEAKKNSTVLFFMYDDLELKCNPNCTFHQKLLDNLSNLYLNKVIELNTRIELLSKRTIREKLLGYFNVVSSKNMGRTFQLPFSFTDLADYLSVDRSAMMRELKLLKDDGLIEKSGNRIKLLYK
jgi:CRP-like cAMP-binding protein